MVIKIVIVAAIILFAALIGLLALSWLGKTIVIEKNTNIAGQVDDDIKEALYYASLAPSSHNTQCWKAVLYPKEHRIEVSLDTTRELNGVDPLNREAYISVGAFVETLKRSLTAYGYRAGVSLDKGEGTLGAIITYERDHALPQNHDILKIIEKRHTDKRSFATTPLSSQAISAILSENAETVFYHPSGTDAFTYVSEGTLAAYTQQANTQSLRDELSLWFRYSNREALAKKDGLPAEQLGFSGIMKSFYYLFTNSESAKGDAFAKQGIQNTASQIAGCAGYFVIIGGDSKAELVEVGMRLQALWLSATEHSIAIHPMSQMMEESPYKEELSGRLGTEAPVQVILRAGTVEEYGQNNKIRRDLKDFVIVK